MADPKLDPRFRPYRAAAYGLHVLVASAFCVLVTWNVVRSVDAMTPPMPALSESALPISQCVAVAEQLWSELETRRQRLAHEVWPTVRKAWLIRLRAARAECAERPGREALTQALRELERLEDLYTT